jgi:hypothetical protein
MSPRRSTPLRRSDAINTASRFALPIGLADWFGRLVPLIGFVICFRASCDMRKRQDY